MSKKQIAVLFLCSLVQYWFGAGSVPLLPVYATQMGASPAMVGIYLAAAFAGISIGSASASWIARVFRNHKTPIVVTGLLAIPLGWGMGHVSSVLGLTALTTLLWYCAGVATSLVSIVAGLGAGQEERGRVFGILTVAVSLGALMGGLSMGAIADRWGFSTMFSIAAGVLALWPLFGLFVADVKAVPQPVAGAPEAVQEGAAAGESPAQTQALGAGFYFFFAAAVLSSTAGFFFLLGRSLLMNGMGFSALALASTNAASNALAMPLPMLLGTLSDRTGRKRYLVAGYVLGVAALAILGRSAALWQFMIASVLIVVPLRTSGIGLALVTDLVPRRSVSRALAWAGSARWIGGILGYAGAGAAVQRLGTGPALAIGMALSAIPILLLAFVRKPAPGPVPSTECEMAVSSGLPAPVGC